MLLDNKGLTYSWYQSLDICRDAWFLPFKTCFREYSFELENACIKYWSNHYYHHNMVEILDNWRKTWHYAWPLCWITKAEIHLRIRAVGASSQCYWNVLMLLKCYFNGNTYRTGDLFPQKCVADFQSIVMSFTYKHRLMQNFTY